MPSCPVCNASVPDDFGLQECPGCQAQLLVHMDGRVEYSGAGEAPAAEPEAEAHVGAAEPASGARTPAAPSMVNTPDLDDDPKTHFAFAGSEMDRGFDADEISEEPAPPTAYSPAPPPTQIVAPPERDDALTHVEPPAEVALDPDDLTVPNQEIPEEASDDRPPIFEVPPDAALDDRTEAFDPDGEPEPEPEPVPMQGLGDIARFGNSDVSAREGSLRYSVWVSGIDTSDVRNQFREAITDRKLMWDTDQILRSLRHGQVRIQNVSAAKAFILISRLKTLPVQVRWEQYAVSQT